MWKPSELINVEYLRQKLNPGWRIYDPPIIDGFDPLIRYLDKECAIAYKRKKDEHILLIKGEKKYFYIIVSFKLYFYKHIGNVFRFTDLHKAIEMFDKSTKAKIDKEEYLLFKKTLIVENLK